MVDLDVPMVHFRYTYVKTACGLRGDCSPLRLQVVTVFGLHKFLRVPVTTWGLRGGPQVVGLFDLGNSKAATDLVTVLLQTAFLINVSNLRYISLGRSVRLNRTTSLPLPLSHTLAKAFYTHTVINPDLETITIAIDLRVCSFTLNAGALTFGKQGH